MEKAVWNGKLFLASDVAENFQLENEIQDFAVVLAFASPLPDVINNIKALSTRHKVIMPSVPVFGNNIFNKEIHLPSAEKV